MMSALFGTPGMIDHDAAIVHFRVPFTFGTIWRRATCEMNMEMHKLPPLALIGLRVELNVITYNEFGHPQVASCSNYH